MSTESEPAYSQDVAVAAITRFYNFIERLYGKTSAGLEHPPPSGWPQITPDLAPHLNLSPEAVELLRHIPYFRRPVCVMTACHPLNYVTIAEHTRQSLQATGRRPQQDRDNPDLDRKYPPHVFPLAESVHYTWGCTIVIDTIRGVAIWHNLDGKPLAEGCPQPDAPFFDEGATTYVSDLDGWKIAPTWRVESFFRMAEEQLMALNWIPVLEDEDKLDELGVYGQPEEEQRGRARIFTEAGWPGESYDPEKAYEGTMAWSEKRDEIEEVERGRERLAATHLS
ncbi:hypothetical protein B0T14DRAFT_607085 [Immersiella caudata]|uniref:Uncharacterized protein n=1 Tax=Immersiella caudata TaxID=314043 RepID=A0AA39TKR5_9PEZI|nr:hypothetical protein B0T14DRAFT_607085 [Immersiella caudata]